MLSKQPVARGCRRPTLSGFVQANALTMNFVGELQAMVFLAPVSEVAQ